MSLSGFLPFMTVGANFYGLLRHGVRILGRSGFEQASFALQRRDCIGRTVHTDDKELAAVRLLGRKIAADACRVVDRKHRVELRIGGQQISHYSQTTVPAASGVLILRQDLDVGILSENIDRAGDSVLNRSNRGPFTMTICPLPFSLSTMY